MGGDDPHDRVDLALRSLERTSCPEHRRAVLTRLVDYWHGPISSADGMAVEALAGASLPEPLRWWYRWAGHRTDILSGQNQLLTPNADKAYLRLEALDDRLQFYVENQCCYYWSTLPEGDDPPVFGRASATEPWVPEDVTLYEHLILACILEAVICHGRFSASSAGFDADKFARIIEHVPPIPIRPWRWCEMAFYAGGGAFMAASPVGEDTYCVWISAKQRSPLSFLEPLLGEEWDHVTL